MLCWTAKFVYIVQHSVIQQIHTHVIRRYNYNYYKIFGIFKIAILNTFKYFIIILVVYTDYIFVHLLDNKVLYNIYKTFAV